MEIVDYDKTKQWDILIVRDKPENPPQGFMLRFAGVSGKETRICCTPEELEGLGNACLNVCKEEK